MKLIGCNLSELTATLPILGAAGARRDIYFIIIVREMCICLSGSYRVSLERARHRRRIVGLRGKRS